MGKLNLSILNYIYTYNDLGVSYVLILLIPLMPLLSIFQNNLMIIFNKM